jgi:tRNA A37 threonylcarbamoyladenosine synthetase subunit TsaC/SUA5/YrdC
MPAATDADAAEGMLGESVRVLLDAGPSAGEVPSTIVDVTGEPGRVLNEIVAPLGAEIVDEG